MLLQSSYAMGGAMGGACFKLFILSFKNVLDRKAVLDNVLSHCFSDQNYLSSHLSFVNLTVIKAQLIVTALK